jgi:ResB-like family protein
MLLDRIAKFLSSLKLTVVLLAFAIVLVWIGTVAQADEGLYQAQTRYFKSWVVVGANMFGHHIPLVWPGGYLLGTTLLVNLLAAHISRFQFTWKKLGIHVAHAGIILLLVGQLITDIFSRETQIQFSEGETKSYAESPSNFQLVFVTSSDAQHNQEIAVPGRLLAKGGIITDPQLPFSIRVKAYYHNSDAEFRAPMAQNGPSMTTNGVGANFDFIYRPDTKTMDTRNVPTAVVEIIGPNGSLGDWVISDWISDPTMIGVLWKSYAEQVGPQMAESIVQRINQPQSIQINGKTFEFLLRPERVYMPFSLTLVKATHSVYPGTEIPKDFRSRVRLQNPKTGENRETEIFMNSPLRYSGLTFYQYQMDAGDMVRQEGRVASSVLQVVRNPSWLTPYIGCFLVALGLVIQFMSHLVKFLSRRKTATQPATNGAPVNGAAKLARSNKRMAQEAVRK